MFRTVLVPLDGSPLAEQALPYAVGIARRVGVGLDLVHVHVLYVLEENLVARYSYDPKINDEHRREEQLYLDGTAKWLMAVSPMPISTAIVNGCSTDGIVERIQARQANLIVMSAHGRGALGRFFLGSVSDAIIRQAMVPVLLIPRRESPPSILPEPLLEHILVALDGSPLAERVLEPALELVRSEDARCTLLRVVETASSLTPIWLRQQEIEAEAYLEKAAGRLREEGIALQTRVVVADRASHAILEEAQRQHCDCIALATHGRGGVGRMLLGSVADKVVHDSSLPVLVYRPSVR